MRRSSGNNSWKRKTGDTDNLTVTEKRIADAVTRALESKIDRLTAEHMIGLESYYSDRDKQRDGTMQELKQDLKTIISLLKRSRT